jgi:hypothetical protein
LSSSTIAASLETPTFSNSNNSTDDSKGHTNSIKYVDTTKLTSSESQKSVSDLQSLNKSALPYSNDDNLGRTFKFKDPKSPNSGFLSSEKNVRLIDNVNPTKFNASLSQANNNLEEIVSNVTEESILPNTYNVFSLSQNS